MSGQALFVTGTDTSVGKTLICGLLLQFLRERGIRAGYQKWVSTGDRDQSADLEECLRAGGLDRGGVRLDLVVPYRFQLPASPHLAAEREGRQVKAENLLSAFQELARQADLLLVEGVGGLLVPLRRDLLLADLLASLGLQTLVVARSGLGTLNHTLLTLEALRFRHVPVLGVVFSDSTAKEEETIVADNLRTAAEMGQVPVFGRLRWAKDPVQRAELFRPIGEAVWEALGRKAED